MFIVRCSHPINLMQFSAGTLMGARLSMEQSSSKRGYTRRCFIEPSDIPISIVCCLSIIKFPLVGGNLGASNSIAQTI